jgi:hypothetical protein
MNKQLVKDINVPLKQLDIKITTNSNGNATDMAVMESMQSKPNLCKSINKHPDFEELWDWCCTEVMRLDNGKDVWNQINKVHQFSKQLSVTETLEKTIEMIERRRSWPMPMDIETINFFERELRQQLSQLNIKQEE